MISTTPRPIKMYSNIHILQILGTPPRVAKDIVIGDGYPA
jgi:hypothetical protein